MNKAACSWRVVAVVKAVSRLRLGTIPVQVLLPYKYRCGTLNRYRYGSSCTGGKRRNVCFSLKKDTEQRHRNRKLQGMFHRFTTRYLSPKELWYKPVYTLIYIANNNSWLDPSVFLIQMKGFSILFCHYNIIALKK
jgi:hypothetical protein